MPTIPPNIDLSIQPQTVPEQAYVKLRDAIMTGQLLPGQRLVEADLAQRMSISRPTLREVLRQLESNSLVELQPNRGARVACLTEADIDQIEEVWTVLTGQIVHRFASCATDDDLKLLGTRLFDVTSAPESGEILKYLHRVNELFTVIFSRCGNPILVETTLRLVARINFLRAHSMAVGDRQRICTAELTDMVESIVKRNPTHARATTCLHIVSSCRAAKESLARPFSSHQAA